MTTEIPIPTELPPFPTSGNGNLVFDQMMSLALPGLNVFCVEIREAVIPAINTVSGEISANVALAESARETIVATANATIYSSEVSYPAGAVVYDPGDGYKAYTSQQNGNKDHAPNSDDRTWWKETLSSRIHNNSAAVDDDGTISDGTWIIDYSNGPIIRAAAGANITNITINNWPEAGNFGMLLLECYDFGDFIITWPTTWNWTKHDLTMTTAFADLNLSLPSDAPCFIQLWSRDGGITIYAKVI